MKKALLLIIAITLSLFTSAQTQQGYVKTKGRMIDGKHIPGQGIKGATVTVLGSNSVLVNTDDGAFSFPVPTKNFQLKEVKKTGFQLVDADIIRRSYTYSTTPLYIVMETPEQQLQDQLESERKIRRTLQRKLQQREDELEAQKEAHKITLEEYQQAMQKLYTDQENNERLISDMAKQYAQMDYDQMDDLNQRISDAILNGRLTEADSLLRSKGDMASRVAEIRMEQRAESQREQELAQAQMELEASKEGTKKKLMDVANDCEKYFDLCKLKLDWDSAAYYIEFRAELDTTNPSWQYEAGAFYHNQHQFEKEKKYALRYLALRRSLKDDTPYSQYLLAFALRNMAFSYDTVECFQEYDTLLYEALEIMRQVVKIDRSYQHVLADFLIDFANEFYGLSQSEQEAMYLEALEIYRRYARVFPQKYEPYVAETLIYLAISIDNDQSVSYLLEAIEIYRRLIQSSSETRELETCVLKNHLAQALFSLGLCYQMNYGKLSDEEGFVFIGGKETYEEIEKLYSECLEIRRELAKDNPQRYELNLAHCLWVIGNFYRNFGQHQKGKSIALCEESSEIYKRWFTLYPQLFAERYLGVLNNLLRDYSLQKNLDGIHIVYEELLKVRRLQYLSHPNLEDNSFEYLRNLSVLIFIEIREMNYEKTEQYIQEALGAKVKCEPYNDDYFTICHAILYVFQRKYDEASYLFQQMINSENSKELIDGCLTCIDLLENQEYIPVDRIEDFNRYKKLLNNAKK